MLRPRVTSASPPASTARLATVCWHLPASLFPSEIIYRSELAGLPLLPASSRWALVAILRLRPSVALQWSGGEWRPAALTVSLEDPRSRRRQYGSELRPAYLPQEVVYNGPERIPFGLWAGASLRPNPRDGTTLSLSYAFDRLLREVTDVSTFGDEHGHQPGSI